MKWHRAFGIATVVLGLVGIAGGQEQQEDPAFAAFRDRVTAAHPGALDPASQDGEETASVAVFVRNQTRNATLDDEVDSLRDLVTVELAASGVRVLDSSDIAESFTRYKVTTREERDGLVDGLFRGGSAVRISEIIGSDYLVIVGVNQASYRERAVGGKTVGVYRCTLSVKILEGGSGEVVGGDIVRKTYPSAQTQGEDDGYYLDLFRTAATDIAASCGTKIAGLRARDTDATLVEFSVRTSIDTLVDGLETGVRAPNELLDSFRRLVGGVSVELDGVALGSAPGTFKASPGLHQLRVTRPWMEPWQRTIMVRPGAQFDIALELSEAGLRRYQSVESLKAALALQYAEAAYRKGIKINFDTQQWRDVSIGRDGVDVRVRTGE